MARKLSRLLVRLLTEWRRQSVMVLACMAGSVAITGGAVLLYQLLVTPAIPDVNVATPPQIASFLGHPRGLLRLPQTERCQFIGRVLERYRDPQDRRELARQLHILPPDDKQQIREVFLTVVQDQFFEDLEQYYQTPEPLRDEFVDNSLIHLGQLAAQLRGSGPDTDLTVGMRDGLPASPAQLNKFIVARTRDRARAQPFIDRVERRLKQLETSERARQEFAAKLKRIQPS
jgi:hypothetical protein